MISNRNFIHGEKVAKTALIGATIYAGVKLTVAYITGIEVMLADAIDASTTIIMLFASYIGLKLSRKSANKNFEYGYYKVETLGSLIISIIILYAGYGVFTRALTNIEGDFEGSYHIIAIIASVISIFLSHFTSEALRKAGLEANSKSLIDNSVQQKIDVIVQLGVIASIVSNYMDIKYVEGIATILISLLIFKVGLKSAKDALFYLLDYWDNPKLIKKIKNIITENSNLIKGIKKIRMRRAGTVIFGEIFVEVDPFVDLKDLEEELAILENKIKEENKYIRDCSIYTYINKEKRVKIGVPIFSGYGLNAKIARSLKQTQAYEFMILKNDKIIKQYRKKLGKGERKTESLIKLLKKEKVNLIIDNGLNSLVYYDLKKYNHVQIYPNFSNTHKVKDAIELITIDI